MVTYEYNGDGNLWKVHQDPSGLNRTTTFTYTSYDDGMGGGETGLLASISDPLGHAVSYTYGVTGFDNPTGTVWVREVDEPGSGGTYTHTITPQFGGVDTDGAPYDAYEVFADNNADQGQVGIVVDSHLRKRKTVRRCISSRDVAYYSFYDDDNNVTQEVSW